MDVSVILACYEEAENLQFLLPALHTCLKPTGLHYELMVVDALEPRDASPKICAENNTVYLNQEEKTGYGAAIRTGIKHAKGQYVLFMDADGTHDHAYIPPMLALRQEYDVVIGSRYIESQGINRSITLFLMSKFVNSVYTTLLGLPFKDISGSFKLYRAEQLRTLHLTADNFDIIEEMLCSLVKKYPALKVKELPIKWHDRRFGKSKRTYPDLIVSNIKTLVKLRFHQ